MRDTGHALVLDVQRGDQRQASITLGPREIAALRNWLVHTTVTGQWDAPEVEQAYHSGACLKLSADVLQAYRSSGRRRPNCPLREGRDGSAG